MKINWEEEYYKLLQTTLQLHEKYKELKEKLNESNKFNR
jgi:hypothetical protein